MINMQNTKGLITLAIYMVILLLFPVFSGLEEVFVGISLSFTIGFFFFIFVAMDRKEILFKGENPFTSTHVIIFLVWTISTVLMIGFKSLEYATIKSLTHTCIIYLFTTIPTFALENYISSLGDKKFLKEINIGDKFYQSIIDAKPITITMKEHHMNLYLEKIWVVYEKESYGVKVYDYDIPNIRKSISISELQLMSKYEKYEPRRNEILISECEDLMKKVKQMYSDKDDHVGGVFNN